MKTKDALGLGSPEGRTVIPVSVWLPLAGVLLVLAGLIAWVTHLSGGWLLDLCGLALVLVMPLATVVTLRRGSR